MLDSCVISLLSGHLKSSFSSKRFLDLTFGFQNETRKFDGA
jgi:hypothetical protein